MGDLESVDLSKAQASSGCGGVLELLGTGGAGGGVA